MFSASDTPVSRFIRRFDVLFADNEALRQRVYKVRHNVFCNELGFAMQTQENLEKNEYDEHSMHLLLRDRLMNTDIACVRVVEPLARGGGLPFESFGLRYIDRKLLDWKQLNPTHCCELSRLAILGHVRRASGAGINVENCENTIPHDLRAMLPVALSYAGIALILARGYEWIFMGGEPRLHRFIARFGLNSRQITPLFEYYGQRALFAMNSNQLLTDMRGWKPEWLELYNRIDEKLTGTEGRVAIARAS